MRRCATCKHWQSLHDSPEAVGNEKLGGLCGNDDKIMEGPYRRKAYGADTLTYSYNEDGVFWTGPQFGCVHHAERT